MKYIIAVAYEYPDSQVDILLHIKESSDLDNTIREAMQKIPEHCAILSVAVATIEDSLVKPHKTAIAA